MASKYALEKAAQAWCKEKTKDKVMDVDLAEAFAGILDDEVNTLLNKIYRRTTQYEDPHHEIEELIQSRKNAE